MRTTLKLALLCALFQMTNPVYADDAILVGGGYALPASQGQIELNVKWVQSILEANGQTPKVFYTDGEDPASDVRISYPLDLQSRQQSPLTSVWSNQWDAKSEYRSHSVPNVTGGTEAQGLESSLRSIVSDTTDDLLFVYNGHGAQSPRSKSGVSLMLWEDTRLPASTLHNVLDEMDPEASFRYVFTQCYSGGFHRLVYANPDKGLKLHSAKRCGFTAESAYRLAEGCSSSINTADYRDYTTFFFAALSGKDRNGDPIDANPDENGDGETTLREAHLYTLASAVSTDLPRSSSEEYLSEWQPWYIRWMPNSAELPNNEYADLHAVLLEKNQISNDANTLKTTRQKLTDLENKMYSALEDSERVWFEVMSIRKKIQHRLAALYPALLEPYSDNFIEFINKSREQVESEILQHPDFNSLIEKQAQAVEMQQTVLESERAMTQVKKILRMKKLAHLKDQLYKFGSKDEVRDYESLVSCEESPL